MMVQDEFDNQTLAQLEFEEYIEQLVQEGRRQRAEGRRNQLERDCDPSQSEAPKFSIWEGLHTLTPFSRGQRRHSFCLLPPALCLYR